MLCIPKANHKKLFDDCYPAAKTLASTAPDYRPNANELGRLCYYAQSKPAKLIKVERLLTLRAAAECRAFRTAPNDKTKAPLMITLGILKELVATCVEGHMYLAPTVQSVLTEVLQLPFSVPSVWDADVHARAASVFAIYVQNLKPVGMEIDEAVSRAVLDVLAQLHRSATNERACLNVLAAMDAVAQSPIFTTSALPQLHALMAPCILQHIHAHAPLDGTTAPPSEPSISVPAPSNEPVTTEQLTSPALTVLHHILDACDAVRLRTIVQQIIAWIDAPNQGSPPLWDEDEWSVWLLGLVAQWAPSTSRYAVPHTIVDALALPTGRPSLRETRLLQALHVILASKTVILGLNMTEMFDGHVHFLLAHLQHNPQDPAIQATIEAVGHLASHTVYTEQLGDFVQQMTPHIQRVQQDTTLPADTQTLSLCALLHCLLSIVRAHGGASHVPLSSWAGTETLLLSYSSVVRATYLQVLLVYLQNEQGLALHSGASFEMLPESLGFLHSLAAHMALLASAGLPGATDSLDPVVVHVPRTQLQHLQSVPSDFALLRGVLDLLVVVAPAPATLALAPALFGLERLASAPMVGDLELVHQTLACRWLVGGLLAQMCAVWQSQLGVDYIHYQVLPSVQAIQLPLPALPERFQPMPELPPFAPSAYHQAPQSPLDVTVVSRALAASPSLQSLTHVDEPTLQAWFLRPWSVSLGLDDARSSARPTATSWSTTHERRALEEARTPTRGPSISVSQLRMALAQPGHGDLTPKAGLGRSASILSDSTRSRMRSRTLPQGETPRDVSDLLDRYSASPTRTAASPTRTAAPTTRPTAPAPPPVTNLDAPHRLYPDTASSMPVTSAPPLVNVTQQLG